MIKSLLLILGATATYAFKACLFYSPTAKHSKYYFYIGGALSLVISTLWLIVTKQTVDPKRVFFLSNLFNLFGLTIDMLLPTLVFDVALNRYGMIGLPLVVIGTLILKFN